jgi:hypothetical protein
MDPQKSSALRTRSEEDLPGRMEVRLPTIDADTLPPQIKPPSLAQGRSGGALTKADVKKFDEKFGFGLLDERRHK